MRPVDLINRTDHTGSKAAALEHAQFQIHAQIKDFQAQVPATAERCLESGV